MRFHVSQKTVRKFCIECHGGIEERGIYNSVRNCKKNSCLLYPHRLAKGRVKLGTIKKFCLWCIGEEKTRNSVKALAYCEEKNCILFTYRFAKRILPKKIVITNAKPSVNQEDLTLVA